MKSHIAIAISLALTTTGATAQTSLSTEVVVDRTIVPDAANAMRPAGLYPRTILPEAQRRLPAIAAFDGYGDINRLYSPLSPTREPALPETSTRRGYLDMGYFPTYNLGLSAGYRILNNERTRLSVSGQFDGYLYHATDEAESLLRYNGGRVNADLDQAIGRGHLLIHADGRYSAYRSAAYDSQSAAGGTLSARWHATAGAVHYRVGVRGFVDHYGEFTPAGTTTLGYGDITDRSAGLDAAATVRIDDSSRAGLEVKGDWLATTDATTLGVVGITPYYAYTARHFTGHVGAEIDLATGGPGSKVHIAPEIGGTWTPSGLFALYLRARGGQRLNALRSLREYTPLMPAIYGLGRSNVPVDATIGFNVGPLSDFSLGAFVAWAKATGWQMPYAAPVAPMQATDVTALRAGLTASYAWRSLLRVSARAEFAHSSASKAWYEWLDRASTVVGARLEVNPLATLHIHVDYDWRGGRKILCPGGFTRPLGCRSDLSAGASYAVITDRLDVFARVENILSRRYDLLAGIESQGFHGLVGLQVIF